MIQFGLMTMKMDGEAVGLLQNVNLDWDFQTAVLYSGNGLYPVDVRVHTATIKGSAEMADLNANFFAKMLGGTATGSQVVVDNLDRPSTFELETELVTDGVTFKLTFGKARSNKLALASSREKHIIPKFDFNVEADADTGAVVTIDVGDAS